MEPSNKKLVSGFKWSAIERIITQVSQLFILLILSRILGPKIYGLMGMLTLFIAIAQTLVDSGFTSSLVRKRKVSQEQYSTIFWFNLSTSCLLYIIIYIFSEYIAVFYNSSILCNVLRILALIIIINALCIIHKAKLIIAMDFRTQAVVSFISVIISGATSILFAVNGGGIWALVLNSVVFSSVSTILFFIKVKWLPSLKFNYRFFKVSFSFSYKLTLASLLNTFFDNLYQLIIGRFYSAMQVGYFVQARNLTALPTNTYSAIIQRVTYRYFGEIKNDRKLLRDKYLDTVKYVSFIFFPLMMTFSFYSADIILLLIGNQWVPAAKYISIMCLCFSLYPIHAISLNILNVYGRSDLFLKLEVVKKIIILALLAITLNKGIAAICWGMVIYSVIATYINCIYTNRILTTSFINMLSVILPPIIIASIAAFFSLTIVNIINFEEIRLIGIVISLVFYLFMYYLYERKTIMFLANSWRK
ncbi:lipopolysaccharide biosynthesis protein [Citrobacter sp. RHBSTW-00524]|uniref:lipopolysaccharide biosynthesis protein n=1 Tax=Citrobacter sp. RHBSTW-00524 TaxID=2742653 RepID=UPI0015EA4126|nr:lipopolysaccharide biosynthesis protein [Citrobacter sp. RHBSTW-00524]QLW40682.1 lipopolysaccharide biosynthesis protein [Citrobacter sp. RHBSTW-00524]